MDQYVHKNLNHLRERVFDPKFQGSSIPLLIGDRSGEMKIPQPLEDLETRMHDRFKVKASLEHFELAELIIHTSDEGKLHFTLDLSKISLSDKALSTLKETLHLLNQAGQNCRSGSAKEALALSVQKSRSALSQEIFTRSAWRGRISREEAERLLKEMPPGTYLLREGDEYTKEMEKNLTNQSSEPLRCYVITLAEKRKKISDRILIQASAGWALYNDNLHIHEYSFQDLKTVIEKAGGEKPYEGTAA